MMLAMNLKLHLLFGRCPAPIRKHALLDRLQRHCCRPDFHDPLAYGALETRKLSKRASAGNSS
jgi:hypothetical protein